MQLCGVYYVVHLIEKLITDNPIFIWTGAFQYYLLTREVLREKNTTAETLEILHTFFSGQIPTLSVRKGDLTVRVELHLENLTVSQARNQQGSGGPAFFLPVSCFES